jgi:hypothetical protein
MIGNQIDSLFGDHGITFHYKAIFGIVGLGLILKLAQQLKSIVIRQPIRG